jgi:hypothetical protein
MMAAEAAALITEEDRAQDLSGLEVQVHEMRERLDRMGPVNVLAVEQSQELEERSTFMSAQRQDLLDSIADLDQAIKKIDRASRERFQEAFQIINQHFGEIFRQLFGGGGNVLFKGRTHDTFGIAYFYGGLSNNLIETVQPIRLRDEQGGEMFYNFKIAAWTSVTADLQFIDPFAVGSKTRTFFAVRWKITF